MKCPLVWSSATLLLLTSQRSAALPCILSQFVAPPMVEDTAGALQLAEALNCSGGSFDVEWVGSVVVEQTIRVFGGTTLNVTGAADQSSFLNGTSKISLFEVHSGTLHMSRLTLANGYGVRGGAIHATDSYLTVVSCAVWKNTGDYGAGAFLDNSTLETTSSSFASNMASKDGGAIYMSASNVLVGDNVIFETNNASSGGATYLIDGSVLRLAGNNVSFSNNTAAVKGGGIYAQHSTVSVTGQSEVSGNSAEFGGAFFANNCSVWVDGDVLFSNNSAGVRGGAMQSDFSAVYISGTVSFHHNSAQVGGGGLSIWTTMLHVRSSGEAAFTGNTAVSGGAAYMGASELIVEGEVLFIENVVSYVGGGLHSDYSFISISGNVLWERNSSPELGGGLLMYYSDMSLQTSGRAAFVGNCANRGGGASMTNGTLLALGNLVFTDNLSKEEAGGGLRSSQSVIHIRGVASWEQNWASAGGGGLALIQTTMWVQLAGTAVFSGNTAGFGGALYIVNSTILVDGDIKFMKNSVVDRGGALFSDRSVVDIIGTAIWANNTAPSKGGGVFAWSSSLHVPSGGNTIFFNNTAPVGGGLALGDTAVINIAGNSTFANNSAGIGAAIKMEQFSSASFLGAVTMLGNTASASGGAMHCESPTLLWLDGVQFVSNYAGVSGGAITTLLAGTEQRVVEAGADPAVILNCGFIDNSAADAGGAFFIAGGFVNIMGSHFRGNFAGRSGGAVLASGVTQLGNCTLERNAARVGPAVTSTVSTSLWSTHFASNTLLCHDEAQVLDWGNNSAFEIACESCAESCSNCTVENPNRVQECQSVLKHTSSPAADGTIETLSLHEGYWRTSSTSKDIRECYETDACLGGTDDYCREGYQGPLCAVCAEGYTTGLGYSCLKCNTGRRQATVTIAAIFLVAVVAAAVLSFKFLGNSAAEPAARIHLPSGGIGGFQSGLKHAKMSQVPKILVVSWQIVTQFSMVASVAYPDIYEVFLKHINVVNLNVGWMLSAGCLINTNFYHNLLLSTIVPLVVLVGVATSHRVTSRWSSTDSREARTRIDRRHASALFWVSFLVYATVTSTIFQTFACDDFDDEKSYLRADHGLECYTSTHTLFMVYAGIMGIIYPFGIPFCYAGILYRGRDSVKGSESQETSATNVIVLRELWTAYRPEAYFYEIVECMRRAVLTGVIVFIFPNTAGQVTTAFLLALLFAAVFMALDPYTSRWDTWAARIGHIVVLMSMFVALLQKVNATEDDDFSQDIFAGVLVLANLAIILAAVAETCGMCLTAVWEARQSVAVQSRAVAARSTQSI